MNKKYFNKRVVVLMIILLVIFIFVTSFFYSKNSDIDTYYFNGNSFSYSEDRGVPDFKISFNRTNGSLDIYNVNFLSRNFLNYSTLIYGLLAVPQGKKDVPGIVLLPGGGGKKEGEMNGLGEKVANLGYAVLTFDQRGVGETGGYYLSLQDDYGVFSKGYEPIQHLSVYDALKAYDVLKEIENVDENNIGIMGESMGGRYAIIAAALDKRLKGVIAISASGFHFKDEGYPYSPFLISIDPDNYIGKISPNYVFMFQSSNDSVVNITDAKETFNIAKEPKNFYEVENCTHGYCPAMYSEMKRDLGVMLEK